MDQNIQNYYSTQLESSRLQLGPGQLEFVRTCEIIQRFLPSKPATVYDIGGGPGAYALWLSRLGYEVHLADPVAVHIEQALAASQKQTEFPLAAARVGDARNLDFENESADAILLMGPFYHLTQRSDRIRSLLEAKRVLRAGGWLFIAAISRWASLLDGIFRNLVADPEFREILEQDLKDGQHRNWSGRIDYFTTAYFHTIEDLQNEILEADFFVEGIFGLEGPGWLLHDFEERWQNAESRDQIIGIARAIEQEPTMRAISAHLLAVARKS